MNTQTQEALKVAIEALAEFEWIKDSKYKKAIQACKEVLAQPAQQQSASENAELKERLNEVAADWQVKHYEIEALKADNERLRKGLQFYADGRHYDYCDKQSSKRFGLDWVVEYGDIAREALFATPAQTSKGERNAI